MNVASGVLIGISISSSSHSSHSILCHCSTYLLLETRRLPFLVLRRGIFPSCVLPLEIPNRRACICVKWSIEITECFPQFLAFCALRKEIRRDGHTHAVHNRTFSRKRRSLAPIGWKMRWINRHSDWLEITLSRSQVRNRILLILRYEWNEHKRLFTRFSRLGRFSMAREIPRVLPNIYFCSVLNGNCSMPRSMCSTYVLFNLYVLHFSFGILCIF